MVGRHQNLILLNGFSKIAAMTGHRIGYASGPEDIIQQMNTLQQYTYVCAPSAAQHAAITALKIDHTHKVDAYREKRDLAYDLLSQNFQVQKPNGAFYIFPQAPKNFKGDNREGERPREPRHTDQPSAPPANTDKPNTNPCQSDGSNGEVFVETAIKNNVLIIPGSVFSEKNTHFRISFAAKNQTIQKGIETIAGLLT